MFFRFFCRFEELFFLLSTTFICFLFFFVWLQRVRSLEDLLGAVHFHLVAWYLWNLFACGGRSGNVWESASRKNRVARWKVSRWGFRPPSPGLHLIVEEGRCVEYQLSLAPFFSLFLFVYSGRGRQPTYMKRRREDRGFPDIKVSRRSKKATSGSNRCFGHSVDSASPCLLSCWQKQGFRPVLPTIGFEPMTLAVWKRYSNRWVK